MAHTFDTKAQDIESAVNPRTLLYTVGTGGTLLVISLTTKGGPRLGGDPTFNNIPMTRAGSALDSGEGYSELWYLLNPPTEAEHTISVPNDDTDEVNINASSYKAGAGNKTILDVTNQNAAVSANPSVSVTTNLDGAVIIDSLFSGYKDVADGNNQQLIYKGDTGSEGFGAQYALQGTKGAIAMSWTQNSDDWALIVAAFIEVSTTTQTIQAKGLISVTCTQTVTAKGNIYGSSTQTIQSKARIATVIYTREAKETLPTNDDNLATMYSDAEIAEVANDDGNRVALIGTGYLITQFKNKAIENKTINGKWNGQVNKAPSEATVYLQVYNHDSTEWENLDSNNTAGIDTDFNLEGFVSSENLSDYYDADYLVSFRVYQQV